MKRFLIGIQPDDNGPGNASSPRWERYFRERGHQVRQIDVTRPDVLDQLRGCHAFMWRHSQYSNERQIARRLFPVLEHELGLCVYPDARTAWHYDDKVAQAYLFAAHGIPTPRTWVFFERREAARWARAAPYPLVLKLWSGAGSSNVELVRTPREARSWIDILFGNGLHRLSERYLQGLPLRLGRASLHVLFGSGIHGEKAWERHKNYFYCQEFLPGNDFDTRVTVIGERAFAFRRFNREGDFRASGSGKLDTDPRQIDLAMVRLALDAAKKLGTQSMAIDGLYAGGRPVIGEISYAYVSSAVQACPGHWDRALRWQPGQLWPEDAQAEDFLRRLEQRHS